MTIQNRPLSLFRWMRPKSRIASCSLVAIGLWCSCPGSARAQEPGLHDAVQSLLGTTGLTMPTEPTVAAVPRSDASSARTYEPAPLEMNSVLIGSVASDQEHLDSAEPSVTKSDGVETIRERYPNRTVKIERQVTQDSLGNYVNHGSWKMWDERGNLVAEGQYDMGARTGRWTRWHRRGDSTLFNTLPFSQAQGPYISQATFEKDLLHGEWTIYDSKQRPLSRIAFSEGQRHGPATLSLPTGQVIRKMTYAHGDLDGEVMELGNDGKLAMTAVYQQGRRLAQKSTTFRGSQGRQTEAVYLFAKLVAKSPDSYWDARFAEYEPIGKDERHGTWTTWYENGQIQVQGEYQHDLPVGQFTWWHPNGQKYAEGRYVDGRQHGVWQWWHRNGQKWTEGEFRRGEQTGQWSSWSEEGRLDQQATYSGSRPQESTAAAEPDPTPESSRRVQ